MEYPYAVVQAQRWACSLPLLLSVCCWATSRTLWLLIDFGWLKATQTDDGWLITYVYAPGSHRDTLQVSDVLISVDHQRLKELGLSVSPVCKRNL